MRRGLVVDDDETFARTLGRALHRRGLLVDVVHDGGSALALAGPDLDFILLDLRLGQSSGLSMIERLREAAPAARIVLLTGFASIATAVEAIKRGADDYLAKPANIAAVLKAIDPETPETDVEDEAPTRMLSFDRVAWEHIQQALRESDGNVSAAARLLGMHRRTLQRKLAKRPAPGAT
ncbi:MAG TPA: response regulator [Pseudomonadota bacterium]|jgi:two-component system response regulator RegA|nr:response regulator [Pseudomonadota bacterium]